MKFLLACSALLSVAASQTLVEAIKAQKELSLLSALLQLSPQLLSVIGQPGKKKSVLAPSDTAITAYMTANNITDFSSISKVTAAIIQNTLKYHVLEGEVSSMALSTTGGQTFETYLNDAQFAILEKGHSNVIFSNDTDGNTIHPRHEGDATGIQITSGLGAKIAVVTVDIKYDDGYIHIVDNLLTLPETCSSTAKKAKLNELLTALAATNLTEVVDTTAVLTCLAPNDVAMKAAGANTLPPDQLATALKYHTFIGGQVYYTDALTDGQEIKTVAGPPVKVSIVNGEYFFNDAKVIQANVITANGVAHVLDKVISPPVGNGTVTPSPTTTSNITMTGGPTATSSGISVSTSTAAAASNALGSTSALVGFIMFGLTALLG